MTPTGVNRLLRGPRCTLTTSSASWVRSSLARLLWASKAVRIGADCARPLLRVMWSLLKCRCAEILGHKFRRVVQTWGFCDGQVCAGPCLVLQPQVPHIQVADLAKAFPAHDRNGRTCICMGSAGDLDAEICQRGQHALSLACALRQGVKLRLRTGERNTSLRAGPIF